MEPSSAVVPSIAGLINDEGQQADIDLSSSTSAWLEEAKSHETYHIRVFPRSPFAQIFLPCKNHLAIRRWLEI